MKCYKETYKVKKKCTKETYRSKRDVLKRPDEEEDVGVKGRGPLGRSMRIPKETKYVSKETYKMSKETYQMSKETYQC